MDPLLHDILAEALRALFIITLPCAASLAVVGLLSGIFQTATSIQEQAFSYALKLGALIGLGAFFFAPMRESMVALFMHAFK